MKLHRFPAIVVCGLALASALGGCGEDGDSGKPQVVASFYPLQFVAEQVAGDHAEVTNLTAPGVEPHDLELSPRQTARLSSADVVVFEKGLQPAVDEAVANDAPDQVVDAAEVLDLDPPAEHAEEGADGEERAHDETDPHFWLDPTLLARVSDTFTEAVAEADPANAADYRSANDDLQAELRTLDEEFRQGLVGCRTRTLVVSHDAFGYLGRRYDLDVHPIAGLSPGAEPSPRHLAELADLIRTEEITTVFSERLASPKFADTLADDLGITTAVLDPLEGLASSDTDADYLSLMRENLAAVRKAGGCT